MNAREDNLVELAPLVGRDAPRLQAIARALHRLDEASCNYGLSERQEKRVERLEAEAAKIAKTHGLKVYVQGDPRGWPLDLYRVRDLKAYGKRMGRDVSIGSCYSSIGVAVCPS